MLVGLIVRSANARGEIDLALPIGASVIQWRFTSESRAPLSRSSRLLAPPPQIPKRRREAAPAEMARMAEPQAGAEPQAYFPAVPPAARAALAGRQPAEAPPARAAEAPAALREVSRAP